jgi:hypothetical protein
VDTAVAAAAAVDTAAAVVAAVVDAAATTKFPNKLKVTRRAAWRAFFIFYIEREILEFSIFGNSFWLKSWIFKC